MKFNPEDSDWESANGDGNFGPHCRNCHRGSSDCSACHAPWGYNMIYNRHLRAYTTDPVTAANNDRPPATNVGLSTYIANEQFRNQRSFASEWPVDWDTTSAAVSAVCSNDGFSWPHRTMGWKMLKDEMFGLDRDGTQVGVGGTKTVYKQFNRGDWETSQGVALTEVTVAAHDLDSACLDCHDPNVWRASSYGSRNPANGIYDDQLLLRGLP